MKNILSLFFIALIIVMSSLFVGISSVKAQNDTPPIINPIESGGTSNPNTTGAGTPNTTSVNVTISNPFSGGGNDLMDLLRTILNKIILPIAAVAVTMWIIWAGFQFVLAQGNEKKVTDAKSNLLWSLIGAGILLGAVGISEAVQRTIEAFK